MKIQQPVFWLGLAALCVFAAGCIPVKNLEKAWADAEVDEQLTGQWVGENDEDSKLAFIMTDQGYQITSGTTGLDGGVKSFTVGGHQFIIVASLQAAVLGFDQVDEDSKSGNLLRYTVQDGKLSVWQYDQDTLEQAIKAGDVPGEALEDEAPTLLELDDQTMAWLAEASDVDEGWSKTVYVRKANQN
ncbi:MAG: hypothetical protein AAGC44_12335 [Planctomycetota bacterium]